MSKEFPVTVGFLRYCGLASELYIFKTRDERCEACDCPGANPATFDEIEKALKFYHDRCSTLVNERNQADAEVRRLHEHVIGAKPPALAPVRQEPGGDGSVRKAHYGSGVQPWDTTLEKGWGPHAAAFCVIRYLRRDKAIEHSRESARWYYNQLVTRATNECPSWGEPTRPWMEALADLKDELTPEEKELLS